MTSELQELTFIGVGPGDPELLTLGALKAIKNASLIAYPVKEIGAKSIAKEIVMQFVEGKKCLPLWLPMITEKDILNSAWEEASNQLAEAFNNGDKKTLKNLLTKDVLLTFENAIEEKKNNPNYQFYSIVVDEVTDVSIIDSLINITLKITSEQFKDNDESTISKKQDTWTFQKKINSNSPIWLLSST